MSLKDLKLENLPRSTQLIIFAVLIAGLMGVFYFMYLSGWIAQRKTLRAEVQKLETAVAQAAAAEAQIKTFKKELAELEARLELLRSILPAEKETPAVLRNVQEMAAASNLTIKKFTPQPVVPKAFYADWPIQMQVEGTYNGLGRFFEKVSAATRIINVPNINIQGVEKSTDPNHTLTATCTATTFVFHEEEAGADKSKARMP